MFYKKHLKRLRVERKMLKTAKQIAVLALKDWI